MTGAGFESSGVGDVFVCEQAQESPAVEKEVTSILPQDGGHSSRNQHGRAAVGMEPSVVYNAWENGTIFLCGVRVIFVFGSHSRFMSSQVVCEFFLFHYLLVYLFSWFGVCAPCFANVDVCGSVCAARPKCCPC